MDANEFPEGYRETLLYQHCGNDAAYADARREMARRKELDRQRYVLASISARLVPNPPPTFAAVDPGSPSPPRPLSPDAAAPPTRVDLQRLAQIMRDYPNEVRDLLAHVVIDIVDEYLGGQESELERESEGAAGEGESQA